MAGALEGIRVVELGQEIQGPLATLQLANMGAEVIKVENRATGDLSRRTTVGRIAGPDAPHATFQQLFLVLNRGKKSMTVDLKTAKGKEILWRLLVTADVLLTNFRPGVLDRLGFAYETVHGKLPRLIYAVASSWGPEGPWAKRPSRDLLAQAASGLMAKTGMDGSPPLPAGTLVADYCGAHMAAMGVLAALYSRERTGRGQRIDTSMYGTLITLQPWEIIQASLTGRDNRRAGRGTQFLHGVWGAFRAADGWIAIAGVDEERWEVFCQLIERPDLVNDPECDNEWRNFRGDRIQKILDEVMPKRTCAEWMERFGPNDVFATPVVGYLELLESEQAIVNGYIREFDHPTAGRIRLSGNAIRMSETPLRDPAPGPALSADTDQLLRGLGYSSEDIGAFRAAQVI